MRSQAPIGVRRGSSEVAKTGPVSFSASSTIVRNLKIWNVLPSSVMRSWRSSTGPLAAVQPDEQREHRQQRDDEQDEQQRAETRDVHHALDHAAPALERDLVQADDRDAVEVLERGADRRVLDQVGHHLEVDALVAQRSG